ncbi:sugar phosphate isomerase/epimerase [Paenibacillus alkaliterrae]|uniref:sugar phosphate isomerase/epimerase family protein n=1 Tax=Paenibacillus alkaliterrae TaxID=320909 RepID=UPI001F251F14|nr:sugar phosphate isomerase/epimerase [Paenibacillus alkaliterrae]MCF2937719.1 sugar phosphate isomerase/epimerase [Paenibacillus alkaliterrae]
MKLQLFHAFWGMNGSLREKFERAASNGYQGIETGLPGANDKNEFKELLQEFGLLYIPQIYSYGNHKETYHEQLENTLEFSPLFVNSHTGKDYLAEEEQLTLFEFALSKEKELGVAVAHETHRGRAMFTPRATVKLLKQFPDLKITADFSHFTCVCESLLHDQEEDLAFMIGRTLHTHGRVGYTQGPQVPHPAAPEYAEELARFEGWWDEIWKQHRQAGKPHTTVTPEFGPVNYMPRIPFTGEPTADLFEVNQFIAKRFSEKYN